MVEREVVEVPSAAQPHTYDDLRPFLRKQEEGGRPKAALLQLEVYPLIVRATTCDGEGRARPHGEREVMVSRVATVKALQAAVCKAMLVENPQTTHLWSETAEQQEVLPPDALVSSLRDGQLVVLEVSLADGSWPRSQLNAEPEEDDDDENDDAEGAAPAAPAPSAAASSSPLQAPHAVAPHAVAQRQASKAKAMGNGLVGLHNLGNTCFLNSSVQCLSHTALLTQFFLEKNYLADLNTGNVMGHQGRLATAYASLVASLWAPGRRRALNPAGFKRIVARLNEQFAGNDQHDAQELLSFLLSGLSEDLNRIAKKPYIEQPDSDGRPDRELADIWWANHLQRELSIIVALFTGQFKSLLTCATCGYASARFEPFTVLQVPLPEGTHRCMPLLLVPKRGDLQPVKYTVRVHKGGKLRDLLAALVDEAASELPEALAGSAGGLVTKTGKWLGVDVGPRDLLRDNPRRLLSRQGDSAHSPRGSRPCDCGHPEPRCRRIY